MMRYKTAVLLILLCWLAACSHAPLTPRSNAASLASGQFKVETSLLPTTTISALYGASDKFDVGMDIEQAFITSVWGRYSFVNNPIGVSLATHAGVYVGVGEFESNGWYTGALMSNQFTSKARWSVGLRYTELDYRVRPENERGGWFDPLDFSNPDDGAKQAHAEMTFSYRFKRHAELNVGIACQKLLQNEDPFIDDDLCLPIIGFHFYRL